MGLVRSTSMSLAGTVLCVLVVNTPTFGQTQVTAKGVDSPPQWAYPENNPNYKPPVDDGKSVRVPNSTAGYTWTQLRTRFIAPHVRFRPVWCLPMWRPATAPRGMTRSLLRQHSCQCCAS